jgi:hypothetical protein
MKAYRALYPSRYLLCLAKQRAKNQGVPFSITAKDIRIGKRCPVLGTLYKRGKDKKQCDQSPTLDRINPKLGYVVGNVVVISSLANRIKSTADARQIGRVAVWLKRLTKRRP